MRFTLAFLILMTAPAAAWEFSPLPVCTLSDDDGAARVAVTYDPRLPQPYAIAVTGAAPWPERAGLLDALRGRARPDDLDGARSG